MLKKQTPAKYVLILFLLFTKNGFAHGFGTRYDLPLPLWMYLSGAVLAIVFSFVLLLWKYTPITQEPTRFRITRLRYIYRSTLLKIIRIIALIFYFLIIIAGFVGKQSPVQNLAPITIWAVWWVGMVYLSASCGNIWSWINPLNIFFQWMQASTGVNKKRFFSPSTQVGIWPAVLLFLIFTGMELNWQGRENPASLASMMIVYSIFTWLGMIFCGRKWWLKHVELFSIIFALFAKIAPSYLVQKPRRGSGEPLLVKKPISFSQVVFVILMLSTVSFDGLMETQAWQNTLQVCAEYFPSLFVLENSIFKILIELIILRSHRLVIYLHQLRGFEGTHGVSNAVSISKLYQKYSWG